MPQPPADGRGAHDSSDLLQPKPYTVIPRDRHLHGLLDAKEKNEDPCPSVTLRRFDLEFLQGNLSEY
jgi:hypothetical protein